MMIHLVLAKVQQSRLVYRVGSSLKGTIEAVERFEEVLSAEM